MTEIGNSPIQTTGTGTTRTATNFKVTVQIDGQIPDVRPGFTCTAEITTATRKQVVAVPIQAMSVRELVYDCDGAFDGFVLDDCVERRFVRGCERSLEEAVRRACRDRSKVTVYVRKDDPERLLRLVVHCCP